MNNVQNFAFANMRKQGVQIFLFPSVATYIGTAIPTGNAMSQPGLGLSRTSTPTIGQITSPSSGETAIWYSNLFESTLMPPKSPISPHMKSELSLYSYHRHSEPGIQCPCNVLFAIVAEGFDPALLGPQFSASQHLDSPSIKGATPQPTAYASRRSLGPDRSNF